MSWNSSSERCRSASSDLLLLVPGRNEAQTVVKTVMEPRTRSSCGTELDIFVFIMLLRLSMLEADEERIEVAVDDILCVCGVCWQEIVSKQRNLIAFGIQHSN